MNYYIGSQTFSSDYLQHWGILGMKWGQRNGPPYPLSGSQMNSAEKAAKNQGSPRHTDSAARKMAKQRAKNLEKARKARAEKAEHDRDKKEALARGTATDIMKFKGELTTQEMNDAVNRLNAENRLEELMRKEQPKVKAGTQKVNEFLAGADNINRVINSLLGFYETGNKVKKIFGAEGERAEKERKRRISEIIKRADPKEILENAPDMTTAEVGDAMKRLSNLIVIQKYNASNTPI